MGFVTKHDYGKKPENKYKNRFVNIIACKYFNLLVFSAPWFDFVLRMGTASEIVLQILVKNVKNCMIYYILCNMNCYKHKFVLLFIHR